MTKPLRPGLAGGCLIILMAAWRAPDAHATPPLAHPNWPPVPFKNIDPQIAVGPHHVILTNGGTVRIYTKDGSLRSTSTVADLFHALWDPAVPNNINDRLRLPSNAPCDRENSTTAKNADGSFNYCLDDYYDARVLFDEFRERFVIVASARNSASKCRNNAAAVLEARRSKIVIAYAKVADPTKAGDWRVSSIDAVPGESCATDACRKGAGYRPGDAADYPSIGLNRNYLMISINNQGKPATGTCLDDNDDDGSYSGKTSAVHVLSADGLATGLSDVTTCKGLCSWSYAGSDILHADGAQARGWLSVANTHGSSFLGDGWIAGPVPGSTDKISVWHFPAGGSPSKPALSAAITVTVPAFDSVDRSRILMTYPQPATTKTPDPSRLRLTYTRSFVQQDHFLYYADVGGMYGTGKILDASVRVAGLSGHASGGSVSFTVGRSAIFHVANEGYGSPALEVSKNRTIVLTYSKFGISIESPHSFVGFGARYLTWPSNEIAVPSGRALATNAGSLPKHDGAAERGKFDNAGIALDPEGSVWMMQPYVTDTAVWAYAVNFIRP